MHKHGIAFHEKHKGQLFCDRSAQDLIDMLLRECEAGAMGGKVTRWQPCSLQSLQFSDATAHGYTAQTSQGEVQAQAVVVASGGLSIPKIGATDLGFRLAQQFGLKVVTPRPALVPLTFSASDWQPFAALAGLSLPVDISTGSGKHRPVFEEDLLFTHRGLSGPAVLQISSYWQPGTPIELNLLPQTDLDAALLAAERAHAAAAATPGVICPFPGGVAASGSKAGSRYKFAIASTFAEYCPTLRDKPGVETRLPEGVASVMEIIINGRDLPTLITATQAAIAASRETPGLLRISAGNYGGRLGKSFVYLHPDKQPPVLA